MCTSTQTAKNNTTKMGLMRQRRPHAIMISVPYQGHINPFLRLAHKLASRGFTVTFVHLEFIHRKLSEAHHGSTGNDELDLFSEARQSGLDIRYTTISDGFPLEFDREIHFEEYWKTMIREFRGRVDGFVGKMIESDPEVVHFLVADTLTHWPAAIAKKYNLVSVSLWTEPALVFTLFYHWDLLRQNGHYPCKDEADEEITYVPGVESISTKNLISIFKESNSSPIITEYSDLAFESVKKADFVLHNTVDELESTTISSLNKYMPNYAIGPVNFFKNLPTNKTSQSFWSESDCTSWLESKPPASVLYVSFGSFVKTNKQVIEEIANGLLLSVVIFIWIIRQGMLTDGGTEVLPAGFEDKVKDRGLVVPWCNQVEVLSHPAVGGFLTHNGWNSTVESMWCGVPMICYPIAYDQFPNRKLVVDDWKIGINLCDNGSSVDRTEVAEKINRLMNGDCSKSLRDEADKLKTILHNALESDGSSERNFDRFIGDLEAIFEAKATNWN